MQEEIETEIYTAGLVVVEKPTFVGFWQVIAGADHWEHEKSKGRVSFVRDPLYRYVSAPFARHFYFSARLQP
ncbi:hypothetical protein HanPSC8_Chr00c327g0807741 [Helianthus annuus]|nr:hypothetical protein HanPSC8_Chr00c327g0807741 [Helianthus annuus]